MLKFYCYRLWNHISARRSWSYTTPGTTRHMLIIWMLPLKAMLLLSNKLMWRNRLSCNKWCNSPASSLLISTNKRGVVNLMEVVTSITLFSGPTCLLWVHQLPLCRLHHNLRMPSRSVGAVMTLSRRHSARRCSVYKAADGAGLWRTKIKGSWVSKRQKTKTLS